MENHNLLTGEYVCTVSCPQQNREILPNPDFDNSNEPLYTHVTLYRTSLFSFVIDYQDIASGRCTLSGGLRITMEDPDKVNEDRDVLET